MGFSLGRVATGVATGGLSELGRALTGTGNGVPSYNVKPQLDEVNKSAETQKGIATGLTPRLGALNQPFQQNTHQTGVDYQNESRAASEKFLNDVGQSSDKLGENLSNSLLRRTMASQPAIQNSIRESLAASGGINRGAYDQAVMQNGQQLSSQLYEGNQNLLNQQLQARQDAMKQAYSVDQNLIGQRLGIDQDTLAKIYASGRTDLINEANQLLGIEQARSGNTLNALGLQQNADLAKAQADRNSQNALLGALLGTAGTVGGAYLGGPAGAMAGRQIGNSVTGVRGTTQLA